MNAVRIFLEANFDPAVCCMSMFFVCGWDLGHCRYVDRAWPEAGNGIFMRLHVVNKWHRITGRSLVIASIMFMMFSDRNSNEIFHLPLTSQSVPYALQGGPAETHLFFS